MLRKLLAQQTILKRSYTTAPQSFQIFDRYAKRLQKDRAASNAEESRIVDYLKDEIAARVADRFLVKKKKEKNIRKKRGRRVKS
jgi:NADH dehydrogenase [ubiquinone] 1 alpha subcomplex assembly factor 5